MYVGNPPFDKLRASGIANAPTPSRRVLEWGCAAQQSRTRRRSNMDTLVMGGTRFNGLHLVHELVRCGAPRHHAQPRPD